MAAPPSFVSEQRRRAADKWWRLAIAVPSVDWFLIKALFNFGLSVLHMLQAFVVSVGRFPRTGERDGEVFQSSIARGGAARRSVGVL